MNPIPSAILPDRGVVAVTGPEAEKLLQGLVTNDIDRLGGGRAVFAGLLSPQGKIQFDFLIVRSSDGFLLDVSREKAADLVKRLTLYRLRSKVEIADRSPDFAVVSSWRAETSLTASDAASFHDPRLAALGVRSIVPVGQAAHAEPSENETAYHAHRVALGVPEGGRDYAFGDTFPHEALFDQLNGVSFEKGCYVGQEIVSRMQHRGTARKRIVQVTGQGPLPASGPEILAGAVAIGALGSVDGTAGLALVRLDRAAEFKSKGITLTAAGIPLTLHKPDFATFDLEPQTIPAQLS